MNKKYLLLLCIFFSPSCCLYGAALHSLFLPLQNAAAYAPKLLPLPSLEYFLLMGRFLKNNTPLPRLTEVLKPQIAEKLNASQEAVAVVRDNTNNFLVGNSAQDTVNAFHSGLVDGMDSSVMHFLNFTGIKAGAEKAAVSYAKTYGTEITEGVSDSLHVLARYEAVDFCTGNPGVVKAPCSILAPAGSSSLSPAPEPFYAIVARHPFVAGALGVGAIAVGCCVYKKINPCSAFLRLGRDIVKKQRAKYKTAQKNRSSIPVV